MLDLFGIDSSFIGYDQMRIKFKKTNNFTRKRIV